MNNKYEFLMSLGSWSRPYQDPHAALNSNAGQPDGVIIADAKKGILGITCNGQGLRRDFSPKKAHGYVEYIALDNEIILTLASITPELPLIHRLENDNSIHLGVQLQGMEEIIPSINAAFDDLMFFGVSVAGRNERLLRDSENFLAVDLTFPSPALGARKILDVDARNIISILRECIAESAGRISYYSYDGAGDRLRQCTYEMLHCDFTGQSRFDYLRAKANELLCLLEMRSVRLSETSTPPSYRMSQSDRESLEKVRLHIENNTADDLSIRALAAIAGFSPNRATALFKNQYDVTIHRYVMDTRMRKAKKLLATTDMPIRDISQAVGYSDMSGFGRAFKSIYGIRPSAMRR